MGNYKLRKKEKRSHFLDIDNTRRTPRIVDPFGEVADNDRFDNFIDSPYDIGVSNPRRVFVDRPRSRAAVQAKILQVVKNGLLTICRITDRKCRIIHRSWRVKSLRR